MAGLNITREAGIDGAAAVDMVIDTLIAYDT